MHGVYRSRLSERTIVEDGKSLHNRGHAFVWSAFSLAAAYAFCDSGLARLASLGNKRLNSIWRDCEDSAEWLRSNQVDHKNLLEVASCVTARPWGLTLEASLASQSHSQWTELADAVFRAAGDHGWLDGDGCHHLLAISVAVWLLAIV